MYKAIKSFVKIFDFFSVPFSFRYKNENNYSTFIGGLFFIIFCIVGLYFGINAFLPFCRRENFSLYFNTINMEEPEIINFGESEEFIAINLVCDNHTDQLQDFFKIEAKYMKNYDSKDSDKIYNTPCQDTDFCTKINGTLNYSYFIRLNSNISGTHKKGVFSYYEISILSKEKDDDSICKTDEFLLNNDCKVELYFTDIKMDFYNYKKPIGSFTNEIFLQLNPESYIKMNTFFVNQSFEDENSLFHEFGKSKTSHRIAYSRNEQYSLNKVIKNGEKKIEKVDQYEKFISEQIQKELKLKENTLI